MGPRPCLITRHFVWSCPFTERSQPPVIECDVGTVLFRGTKEEKLATIDQQLELRKGALSIKSTP